MSIDTHPVPTASIATEVARARPTFTITDAAAACAVSRKTITRKLPELSSFGAAKDDDGVWRIPVEALLAAGLHPGRSLSPTPAVNPHNSVVTVPEAAAPAPARIAAAPVAALSSDEDTVTVSRQRWDDIRIRLARAEAEASERSLALADARLALRALTAGPSTSHPAPVAQAQPSAAVTIAEEPASARRRRWWHLN